VSAIGQRRRARAGTRWALPATGRDTRAAARDELMRLGDVEPRSTSADTGANRHGPSRRSHQAGTEFRRRFEARSTAHRRRCRPGRGVRLGQSRLRRGLRQARRQMREEEAMLRRLQVQIGPMSALIHDAQDPDGRNV